MGFAPNSIPSSGFAQPLSLVTYRKNTSGLKCLAYALLQIACRVTVTCCEAVQVQPHDYNRLHSSVQVIVIISSCCCSATPDANIIRPVDDCSAGTTGGGVHVDWIELLAELVELGQVAARH